MTTSLSVPTDELTDFTHACAKWGEVLDSVLSDLGAEPSGDGRERSFVLEAAGAQAETILVEDGLTHALRTGAAIHLDAVAVSRSADPWSDVDCMRWTRAAVIHDETKLVVSDPFGVRSVVVSGAFLGASLQPEAIVLDRTSPAPLLLTGPSAPL
jgi:hypothetical protein